MSFWWQSVWLPLAAFAGVANGALMVGGFLGQRSAARRRGTADSSEMPAAQSSPLGNDGQFRLASEPLDAERELAAAVRGCADLAADHLVRLEIAIQPGLTVWADRNALRQIVAAPLRTAIERSAGGRVLVGAGRRGGRVQISVLDDCASADRLVQEAQLRDAARLVALQGGTLEVNLRANAGTTVVIRLLEPTAAPAPAAVAVQATAPQPVSQGVTSQGVTSQGVTSVVAG